MTKSATGIRPRRDIVRGIGAAGLGAAVSAPLAQRAFAQTKKPINFSFWTFDNPQQRPWVHKRVKMFMEQNPHVKVDFQWFAFGDLGKKLSVGFATGTAPDGFVSQDWFMPVWLDKGLLAPLDVKKLGYHSYDTFTGDYAKAFVDGATKDGKVYGYPMWFYGYCNYLNTKQFKEVGLDADKDWPQNWDQLGEVAKKLTVKDGDKFVRQGFKFAMHAAQWTMIQFNPILIEAGGKVVRRLRQVHRQQRGRHPRHDHPRLDRAEIRRGGSGRLDRDQPDPGHGLPERTLRRCSSAIRCRSTSSRRKIRRWPRRTTSVRCNIPAR